MQAHSSLLEHSVYRDFTVSFGDKNPSLQVYANLICQWLFWYACVAVMFFQLLRWWLFKNYPRRTLSSEFLGLFGFYSGLCSWILTINKVFLVVRTGWFFTMVEPACKLLGGEVMRWKALRSWLDVENL